MVEKIDLAKHLLDAGKKDPNELDLREPTTVPVIELLCLIVVDTSRKIATTAKDLAIVRKASTIYLERTAGLRTPDTAPPTGGGRNITLLNLTGSVEETKEVNFE